MSCTDCNSSGISLTGSWFPGSPCINADCGGSSISALCVYYNGPNLECSGVDTLDSLEVALQKIDEQICSISGDYSTYNMHCLPDWWEASITTQEDFVDAITDFICTLKDRLDEFVDTTYIADQTALDVRLDALEYPEITCASASVTDADSLQTVLTKYCTKFGDIDDELDITGVNWDQCLTVVSPPTTIAGGFDLLVDQICELYALIDEGGMLPTFNNYESCIAGSSDDSLVVTIGLIKTRLCETPTFDVDNIDFNCIGVQAGYDISDLETGIQAIVDEVSWMLTNFPIFDAGDFTLTPVDAMNPCAGWTVSLATPINQDRLVASNASDTTPGTLVTKLTSAGSIAFDDSSNTDISVDIASRDYGDITVTATGMTWTIDNDAVTFAKMQNVNTGILLGRSTASSGNVEEISIGSGLSLSGGVLSGANTQRFGVSGEDDTAAQDRLFDGDKTYDFVFHDAQVIVRGEYTLGQDIELYEESQMFFNPKRAAFRAGQNTTTPWTNATVGTFSWAIGANVVASADYSAAWGTSTEATGSCSTAWGNNTLASGSRSSAAGLGTVASGYCAFATGEETIASGHHSFAMGYGVESLGQGGLAIGSYNDNTAPALANAYDPLNRAFQIGVGTSDGVRLNALTVLFNGNAGVGVLVPTGKVHIKAGTATAGTAPLKLTSGTNLTTAEAGAFEFNGTNLFFTPSTVRNNILMTASVNSVTATSPNRTLTVVIDGITYYIHAKTTND